MTEPHPEAVPLRTRTLWHSDDGETFIAVEHVYLPEGAAGDCPDCGKPAHDPGFVGLILGEENALLSAEQALTLANRLTRAAELALESEEDPQDIERDMARFAAAAQEGPAE